MSIYDKLGKKTAGIKARAVIERPTEKSPRTAPGMFLNATQRMDTAEAKVEELEARLKSLETESRSREIPLSELHEAPGRRRRLSHDEYAELKENLRHNELVQAITVRARQQGGYEIISGHNRAAIYRELGRETILAIVQTMDDEQADLSGFYANLLQPSLPDFEKYLGFKRRQNQTGKNQKQLSEEAGIPEQTLSDLFSFDRLPEEVHQVLNERPQLLGAKAAAGLAQAANAGKLEKVLDAVRRLASDASYTQAQAMAYVGKAVTPSSAKRDAVIIRDGKKTFCKLLTRDKRVVIDFTDEEEAVSWAREFETLLRNRQNP